MTYSYIMGRILLTLLFITCLSVRVFAQGNDSSVGNEFKDFREELQNEYVDFRKEINAEYIEFLSRAWKEYRLFQGRTPDETPKPLSPVLSQEEKDCREVLVGTEQLIDETLAAKEKAGAKHFEGDFYRSQFTANNRLPAVGLFWSRIVVALSKSSLLSTCCHRTICGKSLEGNGW